MKLDWRKFSFLLVVICISLAQFKGTAYSGVAPQAPPAIEFISAEELKAKLGKREAVTVIDVRASSDIADSKITGAIHVKLRRLKYRLTMPPLNKVSRDSEVVLYCACPNDEASIRGAEILLAAGFKHVRALKGGWVAWKKNKGQTESRPRG